MVTYRYERFPVVVAADAGASLPWLCESTDPSENLEGGLWRIVHRGDDNPVDDWQSLVQPGDMVRLRWKDALCHTTMVVSGQDAAGNIKVVDN